MTNEKGAYFLDIMDSETKQVKGDKTHRFFERLKSEIDDIWEHFEEISEKTGQYNLTDDNLRLAVEASDKLNRVNTALNEWLKQEIA